jgi:3-hydroxyisobutyrate dehydrogenase-like beta-hydroxyacid dehydrogenase
VAAKLTDRPVIGILHPGAMGASLGAALKATAGQVIWAAEGRSDETSKRAELADLVAVRDVAELVASADVVISVCPPAAALAVAEQVALHGRPLLYVDANAVAPDTVRKIADLFGQERVVDAAIIGPPAWRPGQTVLWAAGEQAEPLAALFAGSAVEARVLDANIGSASALKACFGLQSKALPTLWLVLAAAARQYGVEEALQSELERTGVRLDLELDEAGSRATAKAWRWAAEMDEAAKVLRAAGLPDGFSGAAADVYSRIAAFVPRGTGFEVSLVLEALRRRPKDGDLPSNVPTLGDEGLTYSP